MRRFIVVLIAFACALLPGGLLAQNKPAVQNKPRRSAGATSPSAYKLTAIKVTGSNTYSPEDVIKASGLQIGDNVTEDRFKEATQKLGETGLFTDVEYSYSYSGAGTKLVLQVKENDKLIPLVFDNFPWYTDQELIDKVHQDIPMFRGKVPVDGGIIDQVADLIAALLAAKNPQFHVNYLRSGEMNGPIDAIVFSVNGANIRIRNVEYPGAGGSRQTELATAAKKLQGAEYTRTVLAKYAKYDIRPIYLKQGFLKVEFGSSQAHVVSETPDQTVVDTQLPVEEGKQYALTKIDWAGNTIFPTPKLVPLVHAEIGKPANQVQLEEDLKGIRDLYGRRGYVKADPRLHAQMEDAESTVVYTIEVKEGNQYRMGEVELEGLDDKTKARVHEDWKIKQGDVYDASYSSRFLRDCREDLPKEVRWSMKVEEAINDDDKTVDVTLRFSSTRTQ